MVDMADVVVQVVDLGFRQFVEVIDWKLKLEKWKIRIY